MLNLGTQHFPIRRNKNQGRVSQRQRKCRAIRHDSSSIHGSEVSSRVFNSRNRRRVRSLVWQFVRPVGVSQGLLRTSNAPWDVGWRFDAQIFKRLLKDSHPDFTQETRSGGINKANPLARDKKTLAGSISWNPDRSRASPLSCAVIGTNTLSDRYTTEFWELCVRRKTSDLEISMPSP